MMVLRVAQYICLFVLTMSFMFTFTVHASTPQSYHTPKALAVFPTVDPNYIYDQLFYMVTSFQHREAGYDNNLPANVNGHDEFASYWSQEMVRNLQGFGPHVLVDKFPVQGWKDRVAVVPAFNVEVTVPGVTHPEQVVVIGCHYDGEAVSTQSANDDASGCAIELGVAKAMATYWRNHHTYPARTLRFVIFDAEEQGLFGSFHYLNSTVNGDVPNINAMFNEEQNGIAYPLRYLGQMSNPLLPFYIEMPPLQDSQLYPNQSKLSQQQQQHITHFRLLMQQAILPVFQQFQALGFQTLLYHGSNNADTSQPIFNSDQASNIHPEDDKLGGSDQIPFTLAGVPSATFVGNSSYYDSNPPPWSYPFDQKEDTIQLMNVFASGSSQKAKALTLSLALPGMLTTWMLNQPDILGQTPSDMKTPIAAISDIPAIIAGRTLSLDASTAFDPASQNNGQPLTYNWNFGDGTTAGGQAVSHTYAAAGSYTLSLTVTSATGKQQVNKVITVAQHATVYNNPYAQYGPQTGFPPSNPAVPLPTPVDQPGGSNSSASSSPPTSTAASSNTLIELFAGLIIVALLALVTVIGLSRRRPQR